MLITKFREHELKSAVKLEENEYRNLLCIGLKKSPERLVTLTLEDERNILCIQIAGLCHDLGMSNTI